MIEGRRRVLILGAGPAGLAAGLELVTRGAQVTLLERAGTLGGRAAVWLDAQGKRAGNVSLLIPGWYKATRMLLTRLNRADTLREHASLAVFSREHGLVREGSAPSLAYGVEEQLTSRLLTGLLASARGERQETLDEISLRAWGIGFSASRHPQLRHLLDPFSSAALLNTSHAISVRTASAVLSRGGPLPLGVFEASCHENLLMAMADAFVKAGGEIRTSCPVTRLYAGLNRLVGVEAGGQRWDATDVISALPPAALLEILPPELLHWRYFRELGRLRTAPVASLQLHLNIPLGELAGPVVLAESELGLYCRELVPELARKQGQPSSLSCVLTHFDALANLSDQALLERILLELKAIYPELRPARVVRYVLARNTRQPDLLHTTGSWQLRPQTRSPLEHFYLAGDWVRQPVDLACLEGAILSGWQAASALLEDAGKDGLTLPGPEEGLWMRTAETTARTLELPRMLMRRVLARTDRRRHARVEVAIRGYLEDRESHVGWSTVLLTNVAEEGVFLVSEASPRPGARVRLQVRLADERRIALRGKVVRVVEQPGAPFGTLGVGCKVYPEDDAAQRDWTTLVRRRRA